MQRCLNLLIFTALSLIQGCGFQLLNHQKPLNICIEGTDQDLYQRYIPHECHKDSLKVILNGNATNPIEIATSANGNLRQYQLTQTLAFDIYDAKQQPLALEQYIEIKKPFTTNNNAILSSSSEQTLLDREMKKELALQLSFFLRNFNVEDKDK